MCGIRPVDEPGQRGLVLAGCLTMGAAMVSNLLDNNQFEPVYTGWQTEYSGFILVIVFWILTVRH